MVKPIGDPNRLTCFRCDEDGDFQIWIGEEIDIACNQCGQTIATFNGEMTEDHHWIGKSGNSSYTSKSEYQE